ncbi:MAG: hypothetical protein ACLP6Z_00055 [Steroidobacteraceae bacterium]
MTTLDDGAWEDLLSFIEERRVIPIVGPELLQVSTDRGPRLLLDWVAEKLAGRLNVNVAELPQRYTLNDVVCWFLAARGRREEAYVRLRSTGGCCASRSASTCAAWSSPTTCCAAWSRPAAICAASARRAALLGEAAALLESLSAELRPLRDVRLWRERIQKAQQGMG